MAEPLETLVRFARELRREGIEPSPVRTATFAEAAALLPPEDLYLAGRAALLSRRDQLAGYDRAFRRFFGAGRAAAVEEAPAAADPAAGAGAGAGSGAEGSVESEDAVALGGAGASAIEVLRETSFAACSDAELRRLADLLAHLPPSLPRRRTRRHRRDRSGAPDVRRLARQVARTWGEPIAVPRRRRLTEPRPLLIAADVSGSMKAQIRGVLLFARAALEVNPDTEVYAFGTAPTRITAELRAPTLDAALAAAAPAVRDWEGGTRIGASLRTLVADRRLMGRMRGGVAIVVSDGFDTGPPDLLGEAAERLARGVHRLVWLNPLAADPGYEPRARGMRAALPHVDNFAAGHNLRSLQELRLDLRRSAWR